MILGYARGSDPRPLEKLVKLSEATRIQAAQNPRMLDVRPVVDITRRLYITLVQSNHAEAVAMSTKVVMVLRSLASPIVSTVAIIVAVTVVGGRVVVVLDSPSVLTLTMAVGYTETKVSPGVMVGLPVALLTPSELAGLSAFLLPVLVDQVAGSRVSTSLHSRMIPRLRTYSIETMSFPPSAVWPSQTNGNITVSF